MNINGKAIILSEAVVFMLETHKMFFFKNWKKKRAPYIMQYFANKVIQLQKQIQHFSVLTNIKLSNISIM